MVLWVGIGAARGCGYQEALVGNAEVGLAISAQLHVAAGVHFGSS